MKTAVIAAGLLLVGVSAFAADEAVVLMYHRFGDDRHPSTNIRVEQLEAQLDYLVDHGFTVVPLADVVAAISGDGNLPGSRGRHHHRRRLPVGLRRRIPTLPRA